MISLIFTFRPLLPISPHPQLHIHTPFFVPHHSRLTCRGNKNLAHLCSRSFPSQWYRVGERLYRNLFYSLHFDYLPACKTFVLISLLNGYVCAFLAVRRIAQWDRYRLYSKRTRKTGADGRECKLFGEKSAGKLKMLSRSHSRSLHGVLSNGFSLKHYFQFGFWFSWFKLLLTAAVQEYNRASWEQNLNFSE